MPKRDLEFEKSLSRLMSRDSDVEDISAILQGCNDIEEFLTLTEIAAMASVPDTYLCECFFLRYFPTEYMLEDFPVIARDFLKHEFNSIGDYEITEYLFADGIFRNPRYNYVAKILNIMLSMALQGNQYTIELFKNLYQTYYRKEYNVLKKFKVISKHEVSSICSSYSSDPLDTKYITVHVPRILIMCNFFKIDKRRDCNLLYALINKLENPNDTILPDVFEGFSQNIIEESNEFIHSQYDLMNPDKLKKRKEPLLQEYLKGRNFIDEAMKWLGLPYGYVMFTCDEFENDKDIMIRALEIMKNKNPSAEYTFQEVQRNALLLHCVTALSNLSDNSTETAERILDLNQQMYEFENEQCMFKPEKIKVTGPSNNKAHTGNSDPDLQHDTADQDSKDEDNYDEIVKELEETRKQLHKREKELSHYKEIAGRTENQMKELQAKVLSMDAEHEELVKLREYVSHLTEEEELVPESTLAEMTEYLKTKRIVIIGGHDNWLYKLKNQFKKWIFLKAEPNNTIDSRIIEGADYIYFFTDHMCHSTYLKYIKVIRDKGLPFGYIHSINVNGNIQQIYRDLEKT